jgi:C4-dicarboxylate-specific signal transduction histidine kinase
MTVSGAENVGLGLGLTTANALVEAIGGELKIETE